MAYTPAPNPTVVVVPQQSLTATPMQMRCPHCGHEVMTLTKKTTGLCTYIMVGVCCFFCLPCFWVPFVVDAWKDTTHSCPNCNITLGERRMV
uniref:Putative possible membrane-associated motif in lps-induced tumor necrosis factor alpha factor n=1 Tax=Rhipicephalus pulchellus TaxID=72859 RepID=L7M5P1_RHIPC